MKQCGSGKQRRRVHLSFSPAGPVNSSEHLANSCSDICQASVSSVTTFLYSWDLYLKANYNEAAAKVTQLLLRLIAEIRAKEHIYCLTASILPENYIGRNGSRFLLYHEKIYRHQIRTRVHIYTPC